MVTMNRFSVFKEGLLAYRSELATGSFHFGEDVEGSFKACRGMHGEGECSDYVVEASFNLIWGYGLGWGRGLERDLATPVFVDAAPDYAEEDHDDNEGYL